MPELLTQLTRSWILVSNGVDGIHLYTMNNPYVAKRISEAVESIIRS